eukprot:Trichotokara_eunicae@DN6189_c0_g1_i3.p1
MGRTRRRKGVEYHVEDGTILECLTCKLANVRSVHTDIIYEDTRVVVVPAESAMTIPNHLLIIPRVHIHGLDQLCMEDMDLLRHIEQVAESVFDRTAAAILPLERLSRSFVRRDSIQLAPELRVERSPFNSLDHFIVHYLLRPVSPLWKTLKFSPYLPWTTSFDDVCREVSKRDVPCPVRLGGCCGLCMTEYEFERRIYAVDDSFVRGVSMEDRMMTTLGGQTPWLTD